MTDSRAAGYPLLVSGEKSFQLEPLQLQDGSWYEKRLQRLIHQHPRCLPMEQIEPGFDRLIPICVELPVEGGYVDNLLMTSDGNIVIVEAKLWRNQEARRTVVAQALEYATGLFKMNYEDLENAVLKAQFIDVEKPSRLYDMFSHDPEALPEDKFIDRVNHNLINGRIVVLIVGDGIRSQLEDLYDGLQAHAKFQFTFALVEMPVFRRDIGETSEELIVIPRTMLKTVTVERFIIRVDNGKDIQVEDTTESTGDKKKVSSKRRSITANQFYETIQENYGIELRNKLEEFVSTLETIAVYPDFKNSLNLKWDTPQGHAINLGYITRDGSITIESWAPSESHVMLSEEYIQRLSKVLNGKVHKHRLLTVKNKFFRIDEIAEKLDDWRTEISTFIDNIMEDFRKEHSA